MRRGEIWWANLPPPIGRRPVLLLSRNRVYQVRASATVATLTTTIRGLRSEVRLGPADGVPRDCVVNLDTIHTIAIGAIQTQIASIETDRMDAVNRAIRFALDLD